jgi:ankyrin repeat protein
MARYDIENFFEIERLHRAAQEGDVTEMLRLVQLGYSLELFDDLGRAPLHYAVEGGHYKATQWLLEQGANVNSHDEDHIGETPFCYAAQSDYPELAELLLKNGADPDITGWMGQSARTRASKRKDPDGQKIAALIDHFRPPKPNPGAPRKGRK